LARLWVLGQIGIVAAEELPERRRLDPAVPSASKGAALFGLRVLTERYCENCLVRPVMKEPQSPELMRILAVEGQPELVGSVQKLGLEVGTSRLAGQPTLPASAQELRSLGAPQG
jgi:hypothetical protein